MTVALDLGTYRRAADLVQEMVAKVRDGWNRFIAAVHDLLTRAHHFLRTDSVWSTVVQSFTRDVVDAITAVNELVSALRPQVETIRDVLRRAADNALPVVSLFETAIACRDDIAARLAGLSADISAGREIDSWRGAAKQGYERRVRDQLVATDATAVEMLAVADRLGTIGAANTAYVVEVGHLSAELVGQLVTAAIDAEETTAGGVAGFVLTLQRLAEFVGAAVRRTSDSATRLQQHLGAALADFDDPADDNRQHGWPAAASMA